VYLEKAIDRPRHIEIQVLADEHGNAVHLFERECSIQRRHKKIIEESPSPFLTPALREQMGSLAVALVKRVGYVNAGTLEFLVDAERRPYFLEMNTRLQVEHPVTELVTGIDLVREQITVAAGAPLTFSQQDICWYGHAIECRVYAEDPENNFFPSPGKISHLQVPFGPGIRDDSGVELNSEVSIYYDPLISKLAAWGRTRNESLDRLRRALDEYEVGGIKTTLPFFREIVRDKEFKSGQLDTGFIGRFNERREAARAAGGFERDQQNEDMAVIAAAIYYVTLRKEASASQPAPGDHENRWKMSGRRSLLEDRKVMSARGKPFRK
ncbi:MAG: acetyl-CoA carboxylase biotin carboxylase subunit, partial [Pyrinomonadaceae bacterium]